MKFSQSKVILLMRLYVKDYDEFQTHFQEEF